MVKYFYDKYSVLSTRTYAEPPYGGRTFLSPVFGNLYKNYQWNPTTGKFTVSNPWGFGVPVKMGNQGYKLEGTVLTRYTSTSDYEYSSSSGVPCEEQSKNSANATFTTKYSKGGLVQSDIIAEDGTYPLDGQHNDGFWYVRKTVANIEPTINVVLPADAQTLYENDIFAINGSFTDPDKGNVVTVKYSIDGGTARAILADISTGSAISFAKNLTFKSGMLYDGTDAITGALAEGSQHTLKVWAEDDKGGKSPDIIRTFYVVPNRAASLVLNAFVTRTGLIDTDVVNIGGSVADLDANNVIVKYKIGNGTFVEVFNGQANATPKPFDFNVLLADLKEGENTITIQAVDIYNTVTQQILTLRKSKNEVPLTSAVTYYEIIPPNGTADGIVLWIERELGDLNVAVDVSMGMPGETEVFKPMFLESTANLTNSNVEDTFKFDNEGVAASKVVVRITQTRSATTENKAIKKISGVLS